MSGGAKHSLSHQIRSWLFLALLAALALNVLLTAIRTHLVLLTMLVAFALVVRVLWRLTR